MVRVHFNKTFKNHNELVKLLQSRGLSIKNPERAEHYIQSIGYYRLSAYLHPFLRYPKTQHKFKLDATFDKVMMLYRFDKKLRVLLFNEIEKIEVAIRESIINITAENTSDIYWLTNPIHFHNQNIFDNSLVLLKKEYDHSTEEFIEHFKQSYLEPFPPVWILGELMPMGNLNMYYRNLKDKTLKKQIAKRFCLHAPVFESWISVLCLTRNACCHHSRVWNKVNKIIPNDMKNMTRPWISISSDKRRIYYNICIIKYFLDLVSPNNDFLAKLRWLFIDFPMIDPRAMGFPKNWEMEPLWR